MANLKVSIVVRVSLPDGRRNWIAATGKDCRPGPLYLRYSVGASPRYVKAGDTFEEAELAQLKLSRKLKAAAIGAVIPEDETASKSHRITDVIAAYIAGLRENRRPEKSIKAKQAELERFAAWARNILFIEEINRGTLIAYRNYLLDEGLADVTVLNNLMSVSTWLKKNPVLPVTGLLKAEDWPDKPDTDPNLYSETDLEKMMNVAGPSERLLLRFFLGTGMREQEVAHAEISDIEGSFICVKPKPLWGWKPKTKAGVRSIPLGDGLLADLREHCSKGLLFPNPNTRRPEGHFLRIIKDIAKRAGVEGAGCHRFRDTFATDQVRARIHDLRDIAKIMGHENMEMMKLYAAFVDLESEQARKAANVSDRFAAKPKLVRSA